MPIKRHKALQPLSRDHQHGLILAQQLKTGAPQYRGMPSGPEDKKEYTLSFYRNNLQRHFQAEEKILFPFVEGRNEELDKMILELISEHRELERLIKDLTKIEQLEKKLDETGFLLERHIRKEERELFPAIEKILAPNEFVELETKLK